MKSVTYDVEVFPDELAEYMSDSALIDELSRRVNKEGFLERIEDELDTNINNLTVEDYKILREIFIKYDLDQKYRNIFNNILSKV